MIGGGQARVPRSAPIRRRSTSFDSPRFVAHRVSGRCHLLWRDGLVVALNEREQLLPSRLVLWCQRGVASPIEFIPRRPLAERTNLCRERFRRIAETPDLAC